MKKNRLLAALLFVMGGGMMLFGCENKAKNPTIEDMQKRDPKYVGLCEVHYFHGGGMEGSSHRIDLVKKDDQVTLTFYDRDIPGQADLVKVYQVKDIFEELDQFVRKYNLSVWDEFPEPMEYPLDAPSTSLSLYFDPPEGERFKKSMTISYDKDIPREGYQILNEFVTKIGDLARDEDLKDVYFWRDEKIEIGKDIENDDREIDSILLGYWKNSDTRLDINAFDNSADILAPQSEWKKYVLKEKVNEPYGDIDCSWYRIYVSENDEEDLFYLTLDRQYVYVEDGSGNVTLFERNR